MEPESQHQNGINGHSTAGLRVIIVGAGIGGLSTAIGLRQNGHQVNIHESSQFARELGAAIHIPPNAHGLLKRLGIDAKATGANKCDFLAMYSSKGELWRSIDLSGPNKMWQHEWLLGHRVRLHNALKEKALDVDGPGLPVNLHLSSPIVAVDPSTGTVTLGDGTRVEGDVIIGADGVHSVTRASVQDKKPYSSGKSAFRFLVPRAAVLDDPLTSRFQRNEGSLTLCTGPESKVVMYPTTNNTLINFVCIHPESQSQAVSTGDWNNNANLDLLLSVYKDFDKDILSILKKVDPTTVKIWRLLDMDVLDVWTNEKLALMGDAAHHFLPHQGQGGAVAIEDAAALAVVLERGLRPDEVPARLKLYQDIRKSRADSLQQYTRMAGEDVKPGAPPFDSFKYTAYNFGHDEFDHASQRLREWKWAQAPPSYWRMSVAFGPMPGPRQSHHGDARDGTGSTFTTASIKFKTSRTKLQNLFPPGSKNWRFKSPSTFAYASISQTTLNGMEWLGGSGYNHLGLYVHGVEYVKKDGTTVAGTYMPILFENLTDPIISGREELGMPKLYSAIDVTRDSTNYSIITGWQGEQWGTFTWTDLQDVTETANNNGSSSNNVGSTVTDADDDTDGGILVQRYILAVGKSRRGQPEADYAVFDSFAHANIKPKVEKVLQAKHARISFEQTDWNVLPTLHYVIERLAELPVYEVVSAKVVSGTGVSDVSTAQPIQ